MADRLTFSFIRTAIVEEVGEVAIDLLNPLDPEEMKAKLTDRVFAEFLIQGREYNNVQWTFSPKFFPPDEPENDNVDREPPKRA